MPTVRDVQEHLAELGFDPGPADGRIGPLTLAAIAAALGKLDDEPDEQLVKDKENIPSIQPAPGEVLIPVSWMPNAIIRRIITHWTAGAHEATEFDRIHYHVLVEGDGDVIRGIPTIDGNGVGSTSGRRASHTLNCNTGSIGVSMCAMANAVERPFDPGRFPLTETQWIVAAKVVAELAVRYDVPVTAGGVLSHAEVQDNLGIRQRGKWDIAVLPWDRRFDTARKCGDQFRAMVKAEMDKL